LVWIEVILNQGSFRGEIQWGEEKKSTQGESTGGKHESGLKRENVAGGNWASAVPMRNFRDKT